MQRPSGPETICSPPGSLCPPSGRPPCPRTPRASGWPCGGTCRKIILPGSWKPLTVCAGRWGNDCYKEILKFKKFKRFEKFERFERFKRVESIKRGRTFQTCTTQLKTWAMHKDI